MSKNKKIVIYKAIFGNFDHSPKPPNCLGSKYRHVLLSDKLQTVKGWETIVVDKKNMSNSEANRYFKFFPWKVFPGQNTIYTDGHVELKSEFYRYIENMSEFPVFACPSHRSNATVFDELLRNLDANKLSASEIKKFTETKIDLTKRAVECGLILRNSKIVNNKKFAKLWWWFFNEIAPRDQLFINQAASEIGLTVTILPFTLGYNDFFKVHPHKNAKLKVINMRILVALRILLKGKILP